MLPRGKPSSSQATPWPRKPLELWDSKAYCLACRLCQVSVCTLSPCPSGYSKLLPTDTMAVAEHSAWTLCFLAAFPFSSSHAPLAAWDSASPHVHLTCHSFLGPVATFSCELRSHFGFCSFLSVRLLCHLSLVHLQNIYKRLSLFLGKILCFLNFMPNRDDNEVVGTECGF